MEREKLNDMSNEEKAEHYRIALLNVAATGRKWAVAQGGNTPLALIAQMAREALNMNAEEVDEACAAINWGNGVRGKESL